MTRLPQPAQYLLRIDDLCPTRNARRWDRLRRLLDEFSIQPILAVVPENQDPDLKASPPDPGFWQQMRDHQSAGATIALHGLHHVCSRSNPGLIPLHRHGEFAGQPAPVQRERIAAGRDILRGHGLNPRLWVAPRHHFDSNTLKALREEGITYLSDGLARMPFARGGVTWIPMQLWGPVPRRRGLWTICIHPNSFTTPRFDELQAFLQIHARQFTSFDRVTAEYRSAPLDPIERTYELAATLHMRLRHSLRAHSRR